jgi:hypothetical protein
MLVVVASLTFVAAAAADSDVTVGPTGTGGSFAIGDRNAAIGTPVTFRGAQWWMDNTLAGGAAPAALKGFADTSAGSPACGTSWSTAPGNSSSPPAGPLPPFIDVIVASDVPQSGSKVSGDTRKVVVVKPTPATRLTRGIQAPARGSVSCGAGGGGDTYPLTARRMPIRLAAA